MNKSYEPGMQERHLSTVSEYFTNQSSVSEASEGMGWN